jgi:ubiquinone/menaquinone biosynthesis C-methylase UbiE
MGSYLDTKSMSVAVQQRSQPDDYWKSRGFARRYVINNVNGIQNNQGAREFDALCFMAHAQGVQHLVEAPVSILDAGCGHAVRGARLGNYFNAKVTGVDYSEPFLAEAANINTKLPDDRQVELIHASVEDMPFDDEQFDVAITYGLLMSLPTLDRAAAELLRVVKYGIVAIEETDAAMSPEQHEIFDSVRLKTFPGRIYWHNYLSAFGRTRNLTYTPLPPPPSWDMGEAPAYARYIVQKA